MQKKTSLRKNRSNGKAGKTIRLWQNVYVKHRAGVEFVAIFGGVFSGTPSFFASSSKCSAAFNKRSIPNNGSIYIEYDNKYYYQKVYKKSDSDTRWIKIFKYDIYIQYLSAFSIFQFKWDISSLPTSCA